MSSCSCQHLLIACNSSLRVTAGAVGLGPAPPAIGCTQRESLARAGASLAPSPHLGLTTLQRIPRQTRSSPARPVPPPALTGEPLLGVLCGASPSRARPRQAAGLGEDAEKGARHCCQEGGWPCPCRQLLQDAAPPEHRPTSPFIPEVWLILAVGQSRSNLVPGFMGLHPNNE